MREFARGVTGIIFDARIVAGFFGILLSVVTHELFHIIIHWGEIESIRIFPGNNAIVEILFTPTTTYNLVAEEAIAYGITMITLILTAMLISDISDIHEKKSVYQSIMPKSFDYVGQGGQAAITEQVASLLDLAPTTR